MKSTGIVRKVDELGRIVIPKELRRTLEIEVRDSIEIFVDGEQIILKKYLPNMQCMVTGDVSNENLSLADGNIILSPDGAEEILKNLKQYVAKNK